jgi:hypothetical protein
MTGNIYSLVTNIQPANSYLEYITLFAAFLGPILAYLGLRKEINSTKENLITQFHFQNSSRDTYEYLNILLKILKNLDILQNALIYGGRFCDRIESRCPSIVLNEKDGEISVADRVFQFHTFGYEIIEETS